MKLIIQQDIYAMDPLIEWDNPFRFISNHRRYYTDMQSVSRSDGSIIWDSEGNDYGVHDVPAMVRFFNKNKYVVIPVRGHEHGGLSISTYNDYPFNDQWDSGVFGWLYASPEDIRQNFNTKRVSLKMRKLTEKMMRSFVKVWNSYFTGQSFGFTIEDEDGEVEDSCRGFYESIEESGIQEHLSTEAYDALLNNERKETYSENGWNFYVKYQSQKEKNEKAALAEAPIGEYYAKPTT